jgi:carbamoyl-phosphate synthase large subunit
MGELLMAQPLIGHDEAEYTVAVFGDAMGDYSAEITMRRTLSPQGFTEQAVVCELPGATATLKELCQHFKPVGPTNFQFRVHEGALKLLEINPRISSSTSIRAACGYNESMMAVRYFMDGALPRQPKVRPGRAVRYTEEVVTF